MACAISFGDQEVQLNNGQFSDLIDLVIAVARGSASGPQEQSFVAHMVHLSEKEFWPGRGIRIESDFPGLEEQKFWARLFLDTARAIFDRRVGKHEFAYWQAERIWQACGTGKLFVEAVRTRDERWEADTHDARDFRSISSGVDPR